MVMPEITTSPSGYHIETFSKEWINISEYLKLCCKSGHLYGSIFQEWISPSIHSCHKETVEVFLQYSKKYQEDFENENSLRQVEFRLYPYHLITYFHPSHGPIHFSGQVIMKLNATWPGLLSMIMLWLGYRIGVAPFFFSRNEAPRLRPISSPHR